MPTPMPMLSDYPAEKVRLSCTDCPRKAQYDKQAMLEAGGDRTLGDLLDAVAQRLACPNHPNDHRIARYCRLRFTDLAKMTENAYRKAKGG